MKGNREKNEVQCGECKAKLQVDAGKRQVSSYMLSATSSLFFLLHLAICSSATYASRKVNRCCAGKAVRLLSSQKQFVLFLGICHM